METGRLLADVGYAASPTDYAHTHVHRADGHTACSSTSPGGALPETRGRVGWSRENWGAFERNRGRAYAMPYTALIAYENLLIGLDLMRKGETAVSTPYKVPQGRPDRRRLLGRRPRLSDPPPADGQGRASRTTRSSRRRPGWPRPRIHGATRGRTRRRSWPRRCSRISRSPRTSRASTSCGRSGASTRACPAPPTCTPRIG